MGSLLIIFATIFVLAPIAKAYADRISRQTLDSPEVRNELARLRDEVERLNGQVARLEDEHSFMVKLLGDGTRGKLGEGGKDAG